VIGIVAVLVGRAGEDPGREPPPTQPTAEAEHPDADEADTPSLGRTALPFGPFLAMGALFYLFAEPWIQIHFHLPGG
jgi:hypothetical protein